MDTLFPVKDLRTAWALRVKGVIPLCRMTDKDMVALKHLRELEKRIWNDAAEGETA